MLRHEANEQGELQLALRGLTERLDTHGNDLMLNVALRVLDSAGYIDRFDIPGKHVRGTRLLRPKVRSQGAETRHGTARRKGTA